MAPSLESTAGSCGPEQMLQSHVSSENHEVAVPLPRAGFYYLGGLTLLGWNMILTFTNVFKSDMLDGKKWGGSDWAFWVSMCNAVLINIVQGTFASRKVNEALPFAMQYVAGIVLLAVSLIGFTYLKLATVEHSSAAVDAIFVKALVLVCVQGMSSSLFNSSIFALAGSIDPKLMLDTMAGQGLGGVFAAVVGFVVGDSEKGLAFSFMLCTLYGMLGIPIYFCWLRKDDHVRNRQGTLSAGSPRSPLSRDPSRQSVGSGLVVRRSSSFRILRKAAWPQCVTVCFVYVVTFTVFPGVICRWRGGHAATLIATFQLVDVVGRFTPHFQFFHVRRGNLVSLFSFLRVVFLPAFIIVEHSQAEFAGSTFVQLSLMVAFAFTNGYVSTLSMMLGPGQRGVDVDEAAPVGSMMAYFLVLGILIGSLLALLTNI